MERKINNDLLKWKRDSLNKPFFLYGARQVGKTYSVLEFGKKFYKNVAYFNTENNSDLLDLLLKEKNLDKLVVKLSLMGGVTIFPDDTLIIFDNICDEKMIKSLKIFGSNNNPYQVVMISSSRILVNSARVEEFYYRPMYNMDFFEYLSNTDKIQLIDFIKDSYETSAPMPFHQMALDAYYEFLQTGGFPEVVNAKLTGASYFEIETIKKKIVDVYKGEYAYYGTGTDFAKCDEIIRFLPSQLIKNNKKFQYVLMRKGARSKEYDSSIQNMVTNGILNRSYRITNVISPLLSVKDSESFKLYFNDVGLLYSLLFVNQSQFATDLDIRRSLVENDVANTLVKQGYALYYYQTEGKAEIQFVIQTRSGKIVPIEVVDMKMTKAKAMSMFAQKFNITECIRLTEDNFSSKKGIRLIPIYALCCLNNL